MRNTLGTSQRLEQILVGKINAFLPCCPLNNADQNLNSKRCISELTSDPLASSKIIKHRKRPVFGSAHLLPGLGLPFIWSRHRQQMPDRNLVDRFLSALYGVIRKELHHFLVNALNTSFVQRNSCKQSRHTFGHGINIHRILSCESMPKVIINRYAIFDRIDLADVAFVSGAVRNISVQFFFIHLKSLLLGKNWTS